MAGNVWNNPGNVSVQHGTIDVATIMGIANPSFKVNGQMMDFASAIGAIQFKKLTQNPYDSGWNKAINVQAMGNEGTVQYTFMPAVLPVSNFSQSDMGNRSFGTQMNVFGKNIMFLQSNFWTNEFVALTSDNYLDNIQKMLLGTYSKSIAIMKNELSIMENALFCLASGQFLFADEIGKKIQQDPSDPNNLMVGAPQILWSTQAPRQDALHTFLGNIPQAFLKQELNALSTWLMTWGMTITTFAVGYSIDQLALACSYYMRTNLAYVLNLGWPTDTNMQIVNRPSYIGTALSQWYNLVLTDVNTMPYFQNEVGLVTQESMGQVNANGTFSGQPLGYGINNICNMSYTRNIIGMTVYAGALDQYYTTEVPFNPYNIASSKTWYRLGYTWGWGQVHVPNFWGTSWMFLDPNAYIEVIGVEQGTQVTYDVAPTNSNWVNASGDTVQNVSFQSMHRIPTDWYVEVQGNGSTYYLNSSSTPMYSGDVCYPAYIAYGSSVGSQSATNNTAGYSNPCSLTSDTNCVLTGVTWNTLANYVCYQDNDGQWVSATNLVVNNYPNNSTLNNTNQVVFTDPIFIYARPQNASASNTNTTLASELVIYRIHINQLLDDMTQAQAVELSWEPNMGYDTYCFQQLPKTITEPLQQGSYQLQAGTDLNGNQAQTWTPNEIQLPSGDVATLGNSCGLNFAQWALTRSFRALSMNMLVTNKYSTVKSADGGAPTVQGQLNLIPNGNHQLLDVVRVGYDQLYMQPFQYLFNMPNGAPYINATGYSQAPGTQMSYGSK